MRLKKIIKEDKKLTLYPQSNIILTDRNDPIRKNTEKVFRKSL